MAKLQHQHFIPRSYLKNFALAKDGSQLIEAKRSSDAQPKKQLISIRDICVSKNLYTIPNQQGDKKYALETYYAEHIDAVYPEVYRWLVDPDLVKITADQRAKIIMTTMSLYFRTPKFLNAGQKTTNALLDYAVKNFQDKNGHVKCRLNEVSYDFNLNEIDEVRENIKIESRMRFLQEHLANWHEFINFKLRSPIAVTKIYDDTDLITSDNPVIMDSVVGNPFDVFDPTNMIALPLDNKHYLLIYPNTEEARLDTIYRTDRDKWFALTTNLQIEQNCENWIFGKPESVHAHLKDQIKYGSETPENLQSVEDMAKRAADMAELLAVMQKYGFPHQKVAEKVKTLLDSEIHSNDLEIHRIAKKLQQSGFSTE